MADEENTKTTEETSESKDGGEATPGLKTLLMKLGLFGAVVVGGLVAGAVVSKPFSLAKAEVSAIGEMGPDGVIEMQPRRSRPASRRTPPRDPKELCYYDLNRITVTLDEPGMARYVALTITLAIEKTDSKVAVSDIEASKPTLVHRLTVYLAGCKLEDIRGDKNLNRMRREILDMVNSVVWPDQTPLVIDVLFKEFAVS